VLSRKCIVLVVLLLASFVLISCETRGGYEDELLPEDDGLIRTLTLELVAYQEHTDKKLYERIRQFDQERSDVEVEIRVVSSGGGRGMSPWLLDKKGIGNPPDP